MSIENSRLHQDLYGDHRDAMYRAMSFIEKHGGPTLAGDTKDRLLAGRDAAHNWVCAQTGIEELSTEYERFVDHWSPVFLE